MPLYTQNHVTESGNMLGLCKKEGNLCFKGSHLNDAYNASSISELVGCGRDKDKESQIRYAPTTPTEKYNHI